MSPGGSAVPRRVLARKLEKLREDSGISRATAGAHVGLSANTVWRMESGYRVRLLPPVLRALCELYKASEDDTRLLLELLERSNQPGWWYAYRGAIREGFDLYLSLEEVAERLTIFQTTMVPGLLQTDAYRRATVQVAYPGITDDEIDRRVEVQMRRQDRLQDESFMLNVLLSEAALRHRVADSDVMARQMRHLVKVGKLPNVGIRVVPFANPIPHGLLTDSFILMNFPQRDDDASLTESPVAYVEGYTGALYLDKEDEIRQYVEVIPTIEKAALSKTQSRDLVLDITKEYEK